MCVFFPLENFKGRLSRECGLMMSQGIVVACVLGSRNEKTKILLMDKSLHHQG